MKKLFLIFLLLVSLAGFGQSETHNFVTYDTTILAGGDPSMGWNLRVTRPALMFDASSPDTASRPAIIFMVGSGEITNPALIPLYGPHYWLAYGWDGGITLGNGVHYPIIISCQPYTDGPTTRSVGNLLFDLLSIYHIKASSVHLTGLSMGAIRWEYLLSAERTVGGEDYMKKITSIAALSGSGNVYGIADWVRGDPPNQDLAIGTPLSPWLGAKTWVKKYNGKYLALEGLNDGVQAYLWFGTQAMNDTLNLTDPGNKAAYFHYYTFPSAPTDHCCWNNMYNPSIHQWGSSTLNSYLVEPTPGGGRADTTRGTYINGSSIFEWMLRQGDTSLVGAGTNPPPTVSAGTDQTITLPTSSVSLTGTASDAHGIATTSWTQISGSGATITSPSSLSTTITGMTSSGVRVFRLTATDNLGVSNYDDVQITVNAASGSSGSETNNFKPPYDTTVVFPGVGSWNLRISRPLNMFTANDPDTASRPVIIFMVGVGEACDCPGYLGLNGPHAIYNPQGGGWDGRIVMGNGTHYPIYISVQPHAQWPSTKSCRMLIEHIANTYHVKRSSIHLTGLSMGAMSWTRMINSGTTADREASMKLVKSIAALQGQGNAYYSWVRDVNNSAPLYQLGGDSVTTPESRLPWPGDMYNGEPTCTYTLPNCPPDPTTLAWKAYKIWAAKYGGKYFSLNGIADYAGVYNWVISEAMNDTLAGSGYFAWENIGGGAHCCWNTMYDPGNAQNGYTRDWTSVGTLGSGIVSSGFTPGHPNTMGTYKFNQSIFEWMLAQGDTSIVGSGNQSPVASAGNNQTIIYPPTSSVTLSGSGTDGDGTIASYAWTQVSGTAATITSPSSATTTVTGLTTTGIRVFRLTVTDNLGATGTSDVSITVNAPTPLTCSAGTSQTITLPTDNVTLSGSATAGGGGPVLTFAWTQTSGTAVTIVSPTVLSTAVTGFATSGNRVFQLAVTDSAGSTCTSTVTVAVNDVLSGSTKTVNVNLYANNDPYTNSTWNNQLITQATYPYTSGVYNYDYGSHSPWYSTISTSQGPTASTYADNGAGYPVTMCPTEVGRYASYVSQTRTVTFSGLNNAKTYTIKLYETRATAQGTTRNTIGSTTIDIAVQSNVTNVAQFDNVSPTSGSIVLTQTPLNVYVYLNGFTIIENGTSGTNQTPTANAGTNQTIPLPTNSIVLTGSGNDPDGSIVSYAWTQISGTAASIANTSTLPSGSEVTVSGLTTTGVRTFRLTVTDNSGATASADVTVTVNPAVVTTGSLLVNITNTVPIETSTSSASLTSTTVSTNGVASTKWTKFSVPGQTTKLIRIIGSSTAACNGVSGPTGFDSCWVERMRAYYTANGVPFTISNIAVAGSSPFDLGITTALAGLVANDILIMSYPSNGYTSATNSLTLARFQEFKDSCDLRSIKFYCTGTQPRNDFIPADRANLTVLNDSLRLRFTTRFIDFLTPLLNTTDNTIKSIYYYDGIHPNNSGHGVLAQKVIAANIFQTSISSASTITTSTTNNTGITGLVTGKHKFQVAVIDNLGYAASAVDTVNANISNLPPTANAGTNQTITLPLSTVTLTGSATDTDGTISTYAWTQTAGNVAVITSPEAASTTVTAMSLAGNYTFRLTVTDNSGATAYSEVTIQVLPAIITGSTSTILGPLSNLGTSGSPRSNFNPGDTIFLRDSSSFFGAMYFQLRGTATKPIVIINDSWQARAIRIRSLTGGINLKNSQYVKILGTGLAGTQYGIAIDHSLGNSPDTNYFGGGSDAINISGRSKNIIIENISIHNVGNGIVVSQTPGCIDSLRYIDTLTAANSLYPNFVQDSIFIKRVQITGTVGHGIQLGYPNADNSASTETNPYLQTQVNTPVVCSAVTTYPEPLRTGYILIDSSYIDSTGSNGILIGAHDNFSDVLIRNNVVKHNGMNGVGSLGYAIQTTTYSFPQITGNSILNTLSQGVAITGSGHTNRITKVQNNYIDSSGHLNYLVNGWASNTRTLQNPTGTANTLTNGVTNILIASRPVKYQRTCDSITYSVTNNRLGANKSTLDAFHNGVSQLTRYFIEVQDFWQMFDTDGTSTISCNIGLDGSDVFRLISGTFDTLVTVSSSYPSYYLNNPWRNPAISPIYDTVCTQSTAPTANAGNPQSINLPTTAVILNGSGTPNNGGSIITYTWTQTSGTAATIVSAASATTQITGMTTAGVRVFKLTVTQNDNQTASSSVTITVNANPNLGPIANAGTPQTIQLPTTSCTLTGSGVAGAGIITAYEWQQVSGTAATITSPTSASTTIAGLSTAGTRVFRLTVVQTDGQSNTNDVSVTVNPAVNQPPTANAGTDQTIVLPITTVTLTGSGSDPNGTITAYAWTQVSGTAATIGSPATSSTNITGLSTTGVRVFRLTVTDNSGATGFSDVTITVNPAPNVPPTANAGSPQTITLPTSSVTLSGSGTDPDGTIVGYLWRQVSGVAATITSSTSASTTVTGLSTAGVRVFRLRVTDNSGDTAIADVIITVNSAINQPPTANAGADQSITLPTSSATLTGSGTDPDGTIVSYAWSQTFGTAATITSPSSASTTITGMTTTGIRRFLLTVTDNNGAIGSDEVQITVNPAANTPPTADAGTDQIITLPISTTTLTGSGSDPGGSITGYLWTQVGGTEATINDPTSATTTISGLTTSGVRTFRLTVTDNAGDTGYDDVVITSNSPTYQKVIPGRIEAESFDNSFGGIAIVPTTDATGIYEVTGIMIGYYMDYNVTVNTTGLYRVGFRAASPQNFSKFNILLGNLKLGSVNIANTGSWSVWGYSYVNISLTAGAQTLRVISADPEQCNFNFMDFVLQANNQPPTAVAGADQTVYYPPTSIVNLNGSNSTDRDGQVVAYSWAQISGSAVTIQNNSSAITTLTGVTTAGTRGFTLTVQDNNGAVSAPDSIYIVTVANATPVACINPINPVILPVTTTTLNAACSSDDIAIVSYLWTQVSGIVATITSPTASSTTITGLNQVGARVFRLRVTDGQGLYAETDITVNVLSSTRTGADFILKGIKGN